MVVDPTTADSTSNLSLTVSPSHSIPVGGYMKITFSSSWSTSIYQNTILNAQSACIGINVPTISSRTLPPIWDAPMCWPYPIWSSQLSTSSPTRAAPLSPSTSLISSIHPPPSQWAISSSKHSPQLPPMLPSSTNLQAISYRA